MKDEITNAKESVEDKAKERVTLERSELWLLRIAAATGIAGLLSHGGELIVEIFSL